MRGAAGSMKTEYKRGCGLVGGRGGGGNKAHLASRWMA